MPSPSSHAPGFLAAAAVSLLALAVAVDPARAASLQEPPGPDLGSPAQLFSRLADATPAATADAAGFILRKDAATFAFEGGPLTLLEVQGRVVAAVAETRGRFRLAPPDPVERWQVERLFDGPEAVVDFQGVFFVLGPEEAEALQAALPFGPPAPTQRLPVLVEDGMKFLQPRASLTRDEQVVRTLLNGEGEGFLYAHMVGGRDGPHYFRFSTLAAEEVSFGREASGSGDFFERLASFHQAQDYPVPDPTEEVVEPTAVMHYEIESRIAQGPEFSARTTAYLASTLPEGAWVPFHLSPDLRLDSVRWDDGSAAEVQRRGNSGQLWLKLPANPDFRQLTWWYQGKIIDYRSMWYWFTRPTSWYPSVGRTAATFDMTFHTAERYKLLGSGTRTELRSADGWNTSRWVVDRPRSQASFNLGDFEEYNREYPGLPPLRLQVHEEFHERLMQADMTLQQAGAAEAVARDLAGSLSFFQEVFGPVDVAEFNASEIPYSHGQAFPGLIHLSFQTFLTQGDDDDWNEAFRAHEVAHQWWGLSVEPRSYRDRWLSEGLAEFSGIWYLERARFSSESYHQVLKEARERIVNRRGEAGPVSLGTRVGIGSRDEDYSTIVYEKGAWIIHMLRRLFLDLDTLDETAFTNLMRDVAQRFRNRRITTQEFQVVVEEHLGNVDMQWFFDQWVHGADVPSYLWAWRGEEVPEGYKLTLRVRQSEVPDDFQMAVPVTVDFGDEGVATVRIMVQGPETVVDLPILPREPDEVIFNDLESVLAQVRRERW